MALGPFECVRKISRKELALVDVYYQEWRSRADFANKEWMFSNRSRNQFRVAIPFYVTKRIWFEQILILMLWKRSITSDIWRLVMSFAQDDLSLIPIVYHHHHHESDSSDDE